MALVQPLHPMPPSGNRGPSELNANPVGLARRVAANIAETFFGHPWMYLAPLVLLLAFGAYTAANSKDEYRSAGVIHASSGDLLTELTGTAAFTGRERPSTVISRTINDLIGTGQFMNSIIANAGLTDEVENRVLVFNDLRAAISASQQGDNLVAVAAVTESPELSQRLAAATISAFQSYVIANDLADADVRISTYETLRADDEQTYNDAVAALNDYLEANPWNGDPGLRPLDQQLEIGRLQEAVVRADELFRLSDGHVDDAQLAADVAETVVSRRLRLVDEPEVPTAAMAGFRAAAMTVGVFLILGLVLSSAFVVLAAFLDRTVRSPADVEAKFGLDAIAVLPTARR